MKHFKQFLALGLVLSLTAVPVYAEDATITSSTSQDVKVTATVGSSFEVTIPKAVTLTSTTQGTGTYEASIPVTVKGDIPTNEVITVDTTDTITLTNTANTSATETAEATITKGETEFDFNTLTGGKVAETSHAVAVELTPGTWEGTATFNINLGEPEIYTKLVYEWHTEDGYEILTKEGTTNTFYKLSDEIIPNGQYKIVISDEEGNNLTKETTLENGETYGNIIPIYTLLNVCKYVEGTEYMPALEIGLYTGGTIYADNGNLINIKNENISIQIYTIDN